MPLDLRKFAGFSAEQLTEEWVRLGDDWADKRAALRVLKLVPKAKRAKAHEQQVLDAQHAADVAKVNYEAFEKFIELKRTEAVNRRVG